MKNLLKASLNLIGIVFILNSILMSIVANFNFGIIATFVLGILILFYGLFFDPINSHTNFGIFKWLKFMVFISIAFMILTTTFIAIYGIYNTTNYKEDAAIVLGSGIKGTLVTYPLAYRLDKAIEYHQKNPKAIIILSGGQGFQEDIPEAVAMEKYLLQRGVPQRNILLEKKSTNTSENFAFSKIILDEYFGGSYKVAIITTNFHIYRATRLAKLSGLDFTYINSKLQWYAIIPTYIREFFAIIKLWLMKQ